MWKPLPEEERPATLEPTWTIPSSNVLDVENNWASALVSTYAPPTENSLLEKTGDMTTFMNYSRWRSVNMITDQINWANPEGDQVRIDVGRPLPLGGRPGHKFYTERHDSLSHRREVRKHMQILSVVRIKAYSRYGYDYLSEIVLRRADFQEHKIAEKDFKNLYPSDFEDLNLLLLQGHLDHLPGSDKRMLSTAVKLWTRNLVIRQRVEDFQLSIESYQTQLNLTKPGWDAKGFEFKHDYTIIECPRAVVLPVNNNEQKIMRFNEIYKFSDGTLTRILEALDYRVKEFKIKRLNPGMNTRFWTQKDVTRSKEFMSAIERRLKTRRTGKLGDSDVHTLEDPTLILEILSRRFFLRLNLPDHRSVQVKMEMEIPHSTGVYFITACSYSTDTSNGLMKAQVYVSKLPMSMPVQMSQAQDGERPQVDDQRLDLADDLKEAQDHISSTITSHKTKITTSKYMILREESKTTR
ncbi:hypothetical protein Tco_0109412 [Tanacetum coccineum]